MSNLRAIGYDIDGQLAWEGPMSDVAAETRTPAHLWIVGAISLIWNGFGAFDYLMTRTGAEWYVSNMSAEELAYFEAYPPWMDIAWPLGVWGALFGSIGLLLRKGWAVWMFAGSLFGLLLATIYNFVLIDGFTAMAGGAIVVMNIAIWAVAFLLLIYAVRMKKRGVLN